MQYEYYKYLGHLRAHCSKKYVIKLDITTNKPHSIRRGAYKFSRLKNDFRCFPKPHIRVHGYVAMKLGRVKFQGKKSEYILIHKIKCVLKIRNAKVVKDIDDERKHLKS